MKKHKFIGIGKDKKACVLKSLASFEELYSFCDEIEANDFTHYATNWSGCDDMERTLELEQLVLTGRRVRLQAPIIFTGTDYDHGHVSTWTFAVYEIAETKEREVT